MNKMDMGKVAKCHEINERLIAEIYNIAAEKVNDPLLKGIFRFIAHDSLKHAEIFYELAKEYGVEELDPEDCAKFTGTGYGLMGLLKEAKEKLANTSSDEEIIDIIHGIESVETTLVGLDREVVADELKNENKKIMYKELIRYIEEDEERHEKIIRNIVKL